MGVSLSWAHLELEDVRGRPKYFEIHIDTSKMIPVTCDVEPLNYVIRPLFIERQTQPCYVLDSCISLFRILILSTHYKHLQQKLHVNTLQMALH